MPTSLDLVLSMAIGVLVGASLGFVVALARRLAGLPTGRFDTPSPKTPSNERSGAR